MGEDFIYESSNNRWQRFTALVLALLLLTSGIIFTLGSFGFAQAIRNPQNIFADQVPDFFKDITLGKQFIVSTMSGMIIFPIPNEVPFYLGIKQGNGVVLSVLISVAGFLFGNIITYFLGKKLSSKVVYLLSTKKVYELRRKVNQYGIYAIIAVNIIPTPSDVLTFGLGMAKYNLKKLIVALLISNVIKFVVLAYIITRF